MPTRTSVLSSLVLLLFTASCGVGVAHAACVVDSLDTKVREQAGRRVDVVRLYVDSGAPDCSTPRLSHSGSGTVVGARAKVLRGDTKNARFGSEHLFWTAQGDGLTAHFALPGLRTGDIVVLEVESSFAREHTWTPDAYGAAGWASLRWKGDSEPSEANVPRGDNGWFVERDVLDAAGGDLHVRFGPPPVPRAPTSTLGKAHLTVTLQPEAAPPPGEAPLGSTKIAWRVPIGPTGGQAMAYPLDASQAVCQVEGAPEALVLPTTRGCVVREADADAYLIAEWTLPRLRLAGEVGPARRTFVDGHPNAGGASSGSIPWTGAMEAVGPIDVRLNGSGVSFRAQVLDPDRRAAIAGDGSLGFVVPGTAATGDDDITPVAGWWVTAIHGQPILSDRNALLEVVARTALSASVPEPGLPARIRLRSGEEEMIPEIQDLLRSQVRVGGRPGQRSLQARRLLDVRKATFGSEWELALMTARYLRQLRLDALPIPVRPAHIAPADPGMPAGFTHAVVRVRMADGADLWIDPACAVCAPGELRPPLWGADALAEGIERIPEPPEGRRVETVVVQPDGNVQFAVEYSGTAALDLRLALLEAPTNRRIAYLEGQLAGTLSKHSGLTERGVPIRLEGTRQGVLDPPPPQDRLDVPTGEYTRVRWRGERIHEVRVPKGVSDVLLPPAMEAEVAGMELRWSRTLGVEGDGTRVAQDVFTLDEPVVSRDSLVALRERMLTKPPVLLAVPDASAPPTNGAPAEPSD